MFFYIAMGIAMSVALSAILFQAWMFLSDKYI